MQCIHRFHRRFHVIQSFLQIMLMENQSLLFLSSLSSILLSIPRQSTYNRSAQNSFAKTNNSYWPRPRPFPLPVPRPFPLPVPRPVPLFPPLPPPRPLEYGFFVRTTALLYSTHLTLSLHPYLNSVLLLVHCWWPTREENPQIVRPSTTGCTWPLLHGYNTPKGGKIEIRSISLFHSQVCNLCRENCII